MDTRYLLKRRQGWYCAVEVPPSARHLLGTRIVRTLKTRDISIAQARKWRVVADIKEHIERTRKRAARVAGADPITQEGLAWRDAFANDPDPHADGVGYAFLVRMDELEEKQGRAQAVAVADIAYGRSTPLVAHLDAWLQDGTVSGKPLSAGVMAHRQRVLQAFAAWLVKVNLPATVEVVSRAIAGRYVTECLKPSGAAAGTIQNAVKDLSIYWSWLERRGHIPEGSRSPWRGQAPASKPQTERAFSDQEVSQLLGAATGTLADFLRVSLLSGMRREEVAQLRVSDVVPGQDDPSKPVFMVRKGKTQAAERRVPVHSALVALVERRTADKPPTAFLFHELPAGGGRRGQGAGKAFIALRRSLGIEEGMGSRSQVNLHGARRWFVQKALTAGLPARDVSAVVGHRVRGMTEGVYYRADDAARRAVVESVRLP